jgi:hypothetical protein
VLDRAGRRAEALAAWEHAAQTARTSREGSDPWLLDAWASSLIRLGRFQEAAPAIERLGTIGYRRLAFLQLCREHGLLPRT